LKLFMTVVGSLRALSYGCFCPLPYCFLCCG